MTRVLNLMAELLQPLQVPFSTADAAAPSIAFDQGVLRVHFHDWREVEVKLNFHDVVAFSWDDGEAALTLDHRDDTSYQVIGSSWIARHAAVGTIQVPAKYRHFKLCFNAAGILQVIATCLEVPPESEPDPSTFQAP